MLRGILLRGLRASMLQAISAAVTVVLGWLVPTALASAQAGTQVVADNLSYNAGETVRLRVVLPRAPGRVDRSRPTIIESPLELMVAVRYAGGNAALLDQVAGLGPFIASKVGCSSGRREIWNVAGAARTGRGVVELTGGNSPSQDFVRNLPYSSSLRDTQEVAPDRADGNQQDSLHFR